MTEINPDPKAVLFRRDAQQGAGVPTEELEQEAFGASQSWRDAPAVGLGARHVGLLPE